MLTAAADLGLIKIMKSMKNLRIAMVAVLAMLMLPLGLSAQKKAEKDAWNYQYEIQCAGTGVDGTYALKVSFYAKGKKPDLQQAGMAAVHGVIFKGVTGGLQGCPSQPALMRDPAGQQTYKDYFKKFFAPTGDYGKYVLSVSPNVERVKLKGQWKFTTTVQVAKDQLRRDLEAAGVIKGLSSGF